MNDKYTRESLSDLLKHDLIDIIIEMQDAQEFVDSSYQQTLTGYQQKLEAINRNWETIDKDLGLS